MSDLQQMLIYQVEALQKENAQLKLELEKSKTIHSEIAEISTRKALDLKVILSDPNFYKPLSELEKNYE